MWYSIFEQEFGVQVDVSPCSPLPHYPNIFRDSVTPVESIAKLVSNYVNYDHTQNSWNVNFTFEHGEEETSLLGPFNLSSDHFEATKGEISCFQSYPLYDSSNQEDASIFNVELSGHDFDFSIVHISKPPFFDDLPSDVLELPQVVEALQPELMVMLDSRSFEAGSNRDQNSLVSLKDLH